MDSADAILLLPRCPDADDPDVARLLELIASNTGARWVELELRSEDRAHSQTYRIGSRGGPVRSTILSIDGYAATLTVADHVAPSHELIDLLSLALDRIVRCGRYLDEVSLLRGALDTTSAAVLLFDQGGGIAYANSPADHLLARQTEDGLAVDGPGQVRQPLMTYLCATVERVAGARRGQPRWAETLNLSDGSVVACEVMQVSTGGHNPRVGVLALLQPVPALSQLCLDSFCARHGLSPREQDVVRLLFEGLSTSGMAERLNISQHTIRDHLKRLFRKTGARSRSELLCLVSSPGARAAADRASA